MRGIQARGHGIHDSAVVLQPKYEEKTQPVSRPWALPHEVYHLHNKRTRELVGAVSWSGGMGRWAEAVLQLALIARERWTPIQPHAPHVSGKITRGNTL